MQAALYIDGRDGCVDPQDRGLAYGDGLFETMLAEDGNVRWLNLHLERLSEGCRRLAIPLPDLDEMKRRIGEQVPRGSRATIKVILTRGAGPRGYAPPQDPVPTVILFAYPAESPGEPSELAVETLRLRLGENPKLAGIKHLSRLEHVMARLELGSRGADEGLLLDSSGNVVGGTSTNVFALFGSNLTTPRITGAGVCGVMRRVVLERCTDHGLNPIEADLTVADLHEADEIFMTNALTGIRPVGKLDGRAFPEQSVARGLSESLGLARA